jgi:hypothetical protein
MCWVTSSRRGLLLEKFPKGLFLHDRSLLDNVQISTVSSPFRLVSLPFPGETDPDVRVAYATSDFGSCNLDIRNINPDFLMRRVVSHRQENASSMFVSELHAPLSTDRLEAGLDEPRRDLRDLWQCVRDITDNGCCWN